MFIVEGFTIERSGLMLSHAVFEIGGNPCIELAVANANIYVPNFVHIHLIILGQDFLRFALDKLTNILSMTRIKQIKRGP